MGPGDTGKEPDYRPRTQLLNEPIEQNNVAQMNEVSRAMNKNQTTNI